ncbi:MAG: TIGR04283 family arsenosugar biosynthesis glycosyltransferase [Pseudomonadota bacterium]
MTAPVSVIIPVLNAAERLGPCLGILGEALFDGLICEVILADGGSSDGIAVVAEETGAHLVVSAPGRGTQMAAGARTARGTWLLFLHADTCPGPTWATAVRSHISAHPDRAGYFGHAFDDSSVAARIVSGWANTRSALFGLPYGDQGLLIRRRVYEEAGGFPEIPLMEDVALVRTLGRRRLRRLGEIAVTSADRYRSEGWLRRGGRNLGTLARFLTGADPAGLARRYEDQPGSKPGS